MKFVIFVNRRKYEVESERMTAREILGLLGITEGYDLFLLQGEGDPSGGKCLPADEVVEIKPGLHFRAQPGNCTFGSGGDDVIPTLLRQHAEELGEQLGCAVKLERSENQIRVVVEKVKLPEGLYNAEKSDALLLTDVQYPTSAMDMFYLEEHVTMRGGQIPNYASSVVEYGGRKWRQWSWHRNGRWTAGVDDLLSHWAFVEACWVRERQSASPGASR